MRKIIWMIGLFFIFVFLISFGLAEPNSSLNCQENSLCGNWGSCQNVNQAYLNGIIGREQYAMFSLNCTLGSLDESLCGFQTRRCSVPLSCQNVSFSQSQVCQYIQNPTCFDKVQDCHDNSCETGLDCGGPCNPCESCFDGVQNQGEKGIDCGGPCQVACLVISPKSEHTISPLLEKNISFSIYITLILILLFILVKNLIRIFSLLSQMRKDEYAWYKFV